MNTGVAYMSSVKLQRLNSDGEIIYFEEFSILDAFGSYGKLSPLQFSLFSIEEATERYTSFIRWLKESYLDNTTLPLVSGSYIDYESKECKLPNYNWEKKDLLKAETTLKINNEGKNILKTTFDSVGIIDEEPYLVEIELLHNSSKFKEFDYHKAKSGDLIYKSQVPRKDIVFDVNDKGQLIVIGKDAQNYFMNEKGELCYKLK